ncbi:MAG: PLP-dependent aminotransferase family protein [Oscillospiraceae bacterium]|nr:PLP-dependent aminotransferase family protein [Oscillospiraceae bacterium]
MIDLTVCLDPAASRPLYQQLYDSLTDQIRSGRLKSGDRLPGKRSLASQLSVAVNTVDTAYQMLVAEGYLEARAKSGFFVLEYTDMLPQAASRPSPVDRSARPAEGTMPDPRPRFDLSTGAVDTELFPFRTWGRIQKELLYSGSGLLSHGHRQGDPELRRELEAYLRAYRGVVCSPEQIVVGAGMEYLLGLVATLLRGSTAAIENPGYDRPRAILENSGIACRYVDIDRAGLDPAQLEASGADLCYVTPSHHFPTGVTMTAGRRAQLLHWAARQPGRYILEDDYDAEFRFDMRPIPSLQGMAGPDGPVVYLCTFSKSLAPSIRIACMVLPWTLLERYREMFGSYASTVSRFEQQTLRLFLEEGYFPRHLARMRAAYKGRMERLAAALEEGFESIRLTGRHTGLHLLVTLPDGPGEGRMIEAAAEEGVKLRGLSEYYMENREACPPNTIVLGYASLRNEEIPELVAALRRAWGD